MRKVPAPTPLDAFPCSRDCSTHPKARNPRTTECTFIKPGGLLFGRAPFPTTQQRLSPVYCERRRRSDKLQLPFCVRLRTRLEANGPTICQLVGGSRASRPSTSPPIFPISTPLLSRSRLRSAPSQSPPNSAAAAADRPTPPKVADILRKASERIDEQHVPQKPLIRCQEAMICGEY